MCTEALIITMEECGELIQECAKEIRFGDNKGRLSREAGDLMAMLLILHDQGHLEFDEAHVKAKLKKLKKWSSIKNLDDIIEKV